jgi:hypothetical protein
MEPQVATLPSKRSQPPSPPPSVEDGMTMEERVAYLRQRGVEIAFPGESLETQSENTRRVVVTKIPVDEKEDYQEITLEINDSAAGDALLVALRPYFATTSTVDIDKISLMSTQAMTVSKETLAALCAEGSVEGFALSQPCIDNNYTKVQIYLDEVGQLKYLDLNKRAQALAKSCGFNDVPILGDVYVGRTRQFPGQQIDTESFRSHDLASEAVWMRDIVRQNYEHGLKVNRVTMGDGATEDGGKGSVEAGESTGNLCAYKWHETDSTIDICLSHPPQNSDVSSPLTAKTINVKFTTRGVVVTTKTATTQPLLSILNLKGDIRSSECTWTISKDGVELTLEKAKEDLWGSLV